MTTKPTSSPFPTPNADVSALEREIDALVHALYALTPEEIALVEGGGI